MKNQSGITLIALIITIIVMLILVGVTVNVALNGGLFETAQDSVAKTQKEKEKEILTVAYTEYTTGEANGEKKDMQEILKGENASVSGDKIFGWNIIFNESENEYTLLENGEIIEGIADKWDGTSKEKPVIAEDQNWHIYNSAQMKYFADFVNGELSEEEKGTLEITENTVVYLENNLDLGARVNKNGEKIEGVDWIPIGKSNVFIGTFEGNNHYVTGVYVNIEGNFGGLFGNSKTIKNLIIRDSYIKSVNCAGGIVGALRGGKIENCQNINTVVETDGVLTGGIVGQLNSGEIIINCVTRDAYIKAVANCAGGIVGALEEGKIENCQNINTVVEVQDFSAGGIVGQLDSETITINCKNSGYIKGTNQIGGIAGLSYGKIEECHNKGTVENIGRETGKSVTGGIVGFLIQGIVEDCSNSGNIRATSEKANENHSLVGGIVGIGNISMITDCINSGNISSVTSFKWNTVGGIAGLTLGNKNILENCANSGEVLAQGKQTYMTEAGGIIGDVEQNFTGTKLYNSGKITAKDTSYVYVGGIIGRIENSELEKKLDKCFSNGIVIGENIIKLLKRGGIVGSIPESYRNVVRDSYYYTPSGETIGALQGEDYEENNTKRIDSNFNSLEEFLIWQEQNTQ